MDSTTWEVVDASPPLPPLSWGGAKLTEETDFSRPVCHHQSHRAQQQVVEDQNGVTKFKYFTTQVPKLSSSRKGPGAAI